jgi:hypothetical protein
VAKVRPIGDLWHSVALRPGETLVGDASRLVDLTELMVDQH